MVSTGSSLATLAALDVLSEGGTAFDAAITVSALLTVTLPMACGAAGDAAALLCVAGETGPLSLISLGRAPSGVSAQAYTSRGMATVPRTGILSATTPALTDAWFAVHRDWGTLPLRRLLLPAITAAEEGITVTGQFARWTRENLEVLEQPEFVATYAPCAGQRAIGSTVRQPGLARLCRLVAGTTAAEVRGLIGAGIEKECASLGGLITAKDCEADHAEVGPALSHTVAGHQVCTTPPPTQGALLLQNLAVYEAMAGEVSVRSAEGIHILSEIINQTYAWRLDHLCDPRFRGAINPLGASSLTAITAGVNRSHASPCRYRGYYSDGDTTHFVVLDRYGNGVSWVQSLGLGFGAGVGVPSLGLLLCNRLGRSATLNPSHPNCCQPGKRPVNTILPWAVTDPPGRLLWLGGTPGGDAQCQWNAQTISSLLIDGESPLRAVSQPRWTYLPGSDKAEAGKPVQLQVDEVMDPAVSRRLSTMGHQVVLKASVGGVNRLAGHTGHCLYGLDDGRQEGVTIGADY